MAQSVYSANAVGYVTLTVLPGFSMIANQLNGSATTVPALITGCPPGTKVYKFNGTTQGYDIITYLGGTSWNPSGVANAMTLAPGEGIFIKNPAVTNFTLTFVGSVPTGTLNNVIPSGFSIISSQVPQSGLLKTDMGFPVVGGDKVYLFDSVSQSYTIKTFLGGSTWNPTGEPNVAVGQAFFSKKNSQVTWTRNFSVNN